MKTNNKSTNEHINALRQLESRLEKRLLKHIERCILRRTSNLEQDVKQTILKASNAYHKQTMKNFHQRFEEAAQSFTEPLNDMLTKIKDKLFG